MKLQSLEVCDLDLVRRDRPIFIIVCKDYGSIIDLFQST